MIVLSHTSALHCMRHLGAEVVARLPRALLSELDGPFASPSEALDLYLRFAHSARMEPVPLHLLKPHANRTSGSACTRIHTTRNPHECELIVLREGVFAASPETVVRQLASWGDEIDLIQLIYELCGTYAHPSNQRVPLPDRSTFTTRARLRASLKNDGSPGIRRIHRAIERSHDRSASPMETACAMLLALPHHMGGLAFPDFEMNGKIIVPTRLKKAAGRRLCFADLLWADRMVAFEYDSDQEHCGPERIASDSSRRNALLRMGYTVITLTGRQIGQREEFLRTANTLANVLGYRIQPRCASFLKKHDRLRWRVLRDQASIFDAMPRSKRAAEIHPKPPTLNLADTPNP